MADLRRIVLAVLLFNAGRQVASIEFLRSAWLEELPGYREIHRKAPRTFANISFVAENFQVAAPLQLRL